MHLCPCLNYLSSHNCGITSDDLKQLFDKLSQLKSSSPSICSELGLWELNNSEIDVSGVLACMDHLAPLFPISDCGGFVGINNPVSSETEKMQEELRRRTVVSCYVNQF